MNKSMQAVLVESETQKKIFRRMPRQIYRGSSYWVQSLDGELEAVFNPGLNTYFQHGECSRWILTDVKGKAIGRVAAFVDHNKAKTFDVPTGGLGFFECIQDQEAADLLFETCRNWLEEKGMKGMIGPVNFGENNQYWGLLAKGYDKIPYYGTQYHPPYYRELFDTYGFKVHYEQFSFCSAPNQLINEKVLKVAGYSAEKYGYTIEAFDPEQQDRFVAAFVEVFNNAFQFRDSFSPIDAETVWKDFSKLKPILEKGAVLFAFQGTQPVAFLISIPDINPIVQRMRGNSELLGKLKFLWYRSRGAINRLRIAHFGVVESHQRRGVETLLVKGMYDFLARSPKYKEVELSWIGNFNSKMINFMTYINIEQYKTHLTMFKAF